MLQRDMLDKSVLMYFNALYILTLAYKLKYKFIIKILATFAMGKMSEVKQKVWRRGKGKKERKSCDRTQCADFLCVYIYIYIYIYI